MPGPQNPGRLSSGYRCENIALTIRPLPMPPRLLRKKRTAFVVGRIADVDRAQGMKTCGHERTKWQSGRRDDQGPQFSISPPIRKGAETSVGLRIIGQISRKVDGARAAAAQ